MATGSKSYVAERQSITGSVFVGTSLDGFIARLDGGLDWLPTGGGEPNGYEEFWASVDALVIGRNTYEFVFGFGGWPYGEKPVFVLSSRPIAEPPASSVVEQMSGEPSEILVKLAARGIRHVYVDGGITIQRFLKAQLIQRLIITTIPILIGTGIPLFGKTGTDIALNHVATRIFLGGLVQSEYTIATNAIGNE